VAVSAGKLYVLVQVAGFLTLFAGALIFLLIYI
jgi:hypothetical protein